MESLFITSMAVFSKNDDEAKTEKANIIAYFGNGMSDFSCLYYLSFSLLRKMCIRDSDNVYSYALSTE